MAGGFLEPTLSSLWPSPIEGRRGREAEQLGQVTQQDGHRARITQISGLFAQFFHSAVARSM